MTCRLVFGSGSEYKESLLQRLNIPFDVHAVSVDEYAHTGPNPERTALLRSNVKLDALRQAYSERYLLTSDQVVELDGEILDKPRTTERAVEQLDRLQDRTHHLISAITLEAPGGQRCSRTVDFDMSMRGLDREQIRAYVKEDTPLDCAGSYKIESAGIKLFEDCVGPDYTAIIGLPLTRVWTCLKKLGFSSEHAED
jgi:septum formation protein